MLRFVAFLRYKTEFFTDQISQHAYFIADTVHKNALCSIICMFQFPLIRSTGTVKSKIMMREDVLFNYFTVVHSAAREREIACYSVYGLITLLPGHTIKMDILSYHYFTFVCCLMVY
jgi:hypothetical protein